MQYDVIDEVEIGGNEEGYCVNFVVIRRGLKCERNIMRRLCPKCGY